MFFQKFKLSFLLIFFCAYSFVFSSKSQEKILIVSSVYTQPEFIALQAKSFESFLSDQYEFVVLNDAQNETDFQGINNICKQLNIKCFRVPQENRRVGAVMSWASWRHSQAVEYMMHTLGFTQYKGIVMLIDADMFLINNFSVNDFLNGYDLAGLRHGPKDQSANYLWLGLAFFRMNTLPNKKTMHFSPVQVKKYKLDSGGMFYKYLQNNPKIKVRYFDQPHRMLIDQEKKPFYFPYGGQEKKTYLTCSACVAKKKITCGDKKNHTQEILEQLGFRKNIIANIMSEKFPVYTEFLIKDSFFHMVGISRYNKTDNPYQTKEVLVTNFVNSTINNQ